MKSVFHIFGNYYLGLKEQKEYKFSLNFDPEIFSSIWQANQIESTNIFSDIDTQQDMLSSGLKKLILLYNPIYNVLYNIQLSAKPLFENSLNDKFFEDKFPLVV